MTFSIAIPVFGQAEFLLTALTSVLAQSWSYQIAIMDATPDDSAQRVLQGYGHALAYSRHGPDEGQAAAIQEGWDHTDGEIVSWLCADDYLFPNAFEEVARVFREHPEIDVVYGDSVFVDRDGRFIRYFPSINDDISRIVRECCISQPSCFVRRAAVEAVGGVNRRLHYVMDWDLWTRLFRAGARFHYLEKPLSVTRMYPDTKTASNSAERFAEIHNHLRENTGFLSALRSLVDFRLAGQAYPELGQGRFPQAERAFFIAWVLAWRTKVRLIGPGTASNGRRLYGLDAVTNSVDGGCHIHLPHYDKRFPRSVVVTTERPVRLRVHLNGVLLPEGGPLAGGNPFRQVFDVPVLPGPRPSLLDFGLESSDSSGWKLIQLHFVF